MEAVVDYMRKFQRPESMLHLFLNDFLTSLILKCVTVNFKTKHINYYIHILVLILEK